MDRDLNPRLIFVVASPHRFQTLTADQDKAGCLPSPRIHGSPFQSWRAAQATADNDPHAQFAVLFDNLQADIMGVNNRAVLFCACYGHLEFAG